jgi:hypothetical protein
MAGVTAIQFTQEQARTLTSVSAETVRHWRRVIPYLAAKPGKAARFAFMDVVGLAVAREVISTFGVHITNVSLGVNALFQLLADARPTALEDAVAVITTDGAALLPAADISSNRFGCAALVVPIGPLIDRLHRQMVPGLPMAEQAELPFPPRIVRSGM